MTSASPEPSWHEEVCRPSPSADCGLSDKSFSLPLSPSSPHPLTTGGKQMLCLLFHFTAEMTEANGKPWGCGEL
jgi:hypothetical protein